MHERTYKERQVSKGFKKSIKGIKGKLQNKNQQEVSSSVKVLCLEVEVEGSILDLVEKGLILGSSIATLRHSTYYTNYEVLYVFKR